MVEDERFMKYLSLLFLMKRSNEHVMSFAAKKKKKRIREEVP